MVISRYIRFFLLAAAAFFLATPCLAGTIRAFVDRNPVGIDESFQLTLESEGGVDDAPDFSVLQKDFDILGQNQSRRFSMINGKTSNIQSWILTLMAKRSGNLTIPAIAFGKDQSPPVSLSVREAAAGQLDQENSNLVLEVDATPPNAMVQSQVLYTVRLLRSVDIADASLTEPTVEGGAALIEKLGDDRAFETIRNGRRFAVVERRYAIFPQQSGPMTIKPVLFEGQVISGRRSAFDPFARGTVRRLRSREITLQVQPQPSGSVTQNWLPASQLRLTEEWPQTPPVFKVGEPVTRTLTLKARGLPSAQLPQLSGNLPEGLRAYPDQPTLQDGTDGANLISTRQEKIALIPTRPGPLVLPALEIPWWNTQTGRQEICRIAERRITVEPAQPPVPSGGPNTPTEVETTQSEPPATSASFAATSSSSPWWKGLCLFLALGWALTAVAWLRGRKRNKRPEDFSGGHAKESSEAEAVKAVKKACLSNNPAQAKEALLQWGQSRKDALPSQTLGQLAQSCPPALCEEIERLSANLYARQTEPWEGAPLWEAFQKHRPHTAKKNAKTNSPLEPLYPEQS